MKIKGFNIYIILISAIILIGLYFAFVNLYNHYNVEISLQKKLTQIDGIEEVKINDKDKILISLQLDHNYNLY